MQPNFIQTTPGGIQVSVFTDKPYTLEELIRIDEECDQDCELQDCWEDPDSDGYGWERKALAGLG